MKAADDRIPPVSRRHPFATVELFGLPFLDAPNEESVAEHLLTFTPTTVPAGAPPVLITPNVDIVVQNEKVAGMVERLAECAYVLPDGAPIVWASRWAGTPLQSRLAGSTMFSHWWPRAVADERKVVVLCSTELVRAGLTEEHPGATILVAPMIGTAQSEIGPVADDLVAAARAAAAEYCVVCIGHPKDSLIALAFSDRWPADEPAPLVMCLGASAEFHLGIQKRAPAWAQRYGMEWLVRFVREPRRMFRRYFVRDLGFIPLAVREVAARRRS